jgi:hypothetical protein
MSNEEFYQLHEEDLLINYTEGDLIYYLKQLNRQGLFDIVCENLEGFVEDCIKYAAEAMIEKRDEAREQERIISQGVEMI